MSRLSRAALLTACLASPALAAAPAAEASQLTLGYQCTYPLIGDQALLVDVDVPLPEHLERNERTPQMKIQARAVAGGVAYQGLAMVGARSVEGKAHATASLNMPDGARIPLTIPMTVGAYTVPTSAPAGGMALGATGIAPGVRFGAEGLARIGVEAIRLNLIARDASGAPITGLSRLQTVAASDADPATFDVPCALAPASQSTTLGVIAVGSAEVPPASTPAATTMPPTLSTTAAMSYTLGGTSEMRTQTKGIVPVKGRISTVIDLTTGKYRGTMVLDDGTAALKSAGLPVTVTTGYESVGEVTGTLVNGQLTSISQSIIHVRKVMLGQHDLLKTAKDCHSEKPSVFDLKSTAPFSPLTGGTISGSYAISPLLDCGALGHTISHLTAGSGNLINMSLTPVF